jgi:hypothetical protein
MACHWSRVIHIRHPSHVVAELTLDNRALKDVLAKNF